ncbi:hypothetical protein A3709_07580 [Halioglobus sp. HI00S01]|uniref:flagellar export protein FliJ n=1 Tax=Halioglobus sp. HI00S01 TaxID=1822214 RepID=UPI0007C2B647|nr:flagellar FliJ family protein [Halioglobus sp. HI00S01]KZX54877.1 hypothetical protein A3709_07580 [Halioglobus sp. HI00S01]
MKTDAVNYLKDKAEQKKLSDTACFSRDRASKAHLQEQCNALHAYRNEYREKLRLALIEGSPLQLVQEYQVFIGSLDRAIEHANLSMERQERDIEQSMLNMKDSIREHASLNALCTRREERQIEEKNKRELKEMDMIVTSLYQRKQRSEL